MIIFYIFYVFLCFIVGDVMFRERFNPLYNENEHDLWVKHKIKKYLTSLSWPFSGT